MASEMHVTPLQDGLSETIARALGTSPEEVVKSGEDWTRAVRETLQGLETVATPKFVFFAENVAVLPLWIAMIVWPEKPLTKAVISSYAPLVAVCLVHLWLGFEAAQNPAFLQSFASGINLAGLAKAFSEEAPAAAVWAHFLAQDLFVGRWVYMDGQRNGVFTKHSLALCCLLGPPGVLSHLITRTLYSVIKPNIRDIMQPDSTQDKPSTEADLKEIIARAKKEATAIVDNARSEAAAQASSLLEAAETEALDILKGAEVERSALLKMKDTVSSGDRDSTGDDKAIADTKSGPEKSVGKTTSVADENSMGVAAAATGNVNAVGDEKDEEGKKDMQDAKDVNIASAPVDAKLPIEATN